MNKKLTWKLSSLKKPPLRQNTILLENNNKMRGLRSETCSFKFKWSNQT